jgi:DNA invertase Pin-like site-specific DNA recombinase
MLLKEINSMGDVKKRAIIYLRASTNERMQANSLDVQRAIVTDFANRNGYGIEGEFVEYASGSDDDRPAFNAALNQAKKDNMVLISWRVDRLSRSLSVFNKINDSLHLLRFAELGDVEPNLMVLSVLIAAGQNELANTRVRIRETFRILKERDGRTFGNPNIVTDAIPAGLEVRRRNASQFNTRIQDIVVNLRKCGYNLKECVAQLNGPLEITTRRGATWTRQSLARVLSY